MTIGDIWFFLSNLYNILNMPDLNIICQLNSYLSNYFTALSECSMLAADYVLLWILYLASYLSKKNKYAIDELKPMRKTNESAIKYKNKYLKRCNQSQPTTTTNNLIKKKKLKKNFKEKFLQNSLFLIDTFRQRKIDYYSKITNREGFLVILFVFVCLYSLSFILWTHGVYAKDEKDHYKLANLSDINFQESSIEPIKKCSEFVFAKNFMSIYSISIGLFRFICIFCNVTTSVLYHIKFRSHIFILLSNKFNHNEKEKLKSYNYKQFHLFYSTECTKLNYNKKAEQNDDETKSRENYKLHSMHLLFVQLYAIFAFIYSFLIFPIILKEFIESIHHFKQRNMTNTLIELDLVKNHSLLFDIEDMFSEENRTDNKNHTADFMNSFLLSNPVANMELANYSEFILLSQKLAHLVKLPILVVFLIHINFIFKFKF